jgi:hypothetical protein
MLTFSRQLLYYPFNAFFVLFGNIIHVPLSDHYIQDVRLLRSTVSYYTEMSSKGSAFAGKLESVAHAFASLAELYVQEMTKRNALDISNAAQPFPNTFSGVEQISGLSTSARDVPLVSADGTFPAFDFDFSSNNNLLDYFIGSDLRGPDIVAQTDFRTEQRFATEGEGSYKSPQSVLSHESMGFGQSDIFGRLENWSAGRKRPLECTFDWFSWDSSTNPER